MAYRKGGVKGVFRLISALPVKCHKSFICLIKPKRLELIWEVVCPGDEIRFLGKSDMFSNIMGQYLGKLTEAGEGNTKALQEFVVEAAKKLDIREPVKLIRSNSKMPNLLTYWQDSVKGAAPQTNVIVTDGAMGLLNHDELKAMIGHEMSHIKDGRFISHTARTLSIYTLPLAFAAGYYVLDKAYRKKEHSEDKNLSMMDAIKQVVIDEKLGLSKPTNSKANDAIGQKTDLYEQCLRWGGTVAAAAVGLAAGLGLTRYMSLAAEFRSDRTGAMLTNPEAMVSAVKKLMGHAEEMANKQSFSGGFITTSPTIDSALTKLWQRIKGYYQQEMMLLDLEYIHAHPTTAQREAALHAFKNSPDFRTRLANNAATFMDNGLLK